MPTTRISQGLDLTGSGVRIDVRSVTASETLTVSDHKILVDCTAGAVTLTLPPAATLGTGFTYKIQKIDATANAVTLDADLSETIDGATTKALTAQYGGCEITVSGSAWYSFGSIPAAVNQTWTSTDAGATGVALTAYHNSASPANSDQNVVLNLDGNDDGGNQTHYARIVALVIDPVNATEDGMLRLQVMKAGTLGNVLVLDATGAAVTGLLTADTATIASTLTQTAGVHYIGDTANVNMVQGITLNQGADDNEILTLKSSDVSHAATSATEADTYGYFGKVIGADGGLLVRGFADTGARGVSIEGSAPTPDTGAKSGSSLGAVNIRGYVPSAGLLADIGANANLLIVGSTNTQFILDSDGDSHQNVGTAWTNFDDHDDIALLNTLADAVSRPGDPIKTEFHDFLTYNREALEHARLVSFNDDGHHFVNMSRLTMLLVGATRQLGLEVGALKSQLALREG